MSTADTGETTPGAEINPVTWSIGLTDSIALKYEHSLVNELSVLSSTGKSGLKSRLTRRVGT